MKPAFGALEEPWTALYVGDCREVLPKVTRDEKARLIFADPPFNWSRDYDRHGAGDAWDDRRAADEYLEFTHRWLDACVEALADDGALWVNIPDDWAAEIVVHLKNACGMQMMNWCVWHYRFGQNTLGRFINSKVHVLYFVKDRERRVSNGDAV